MAAPRKVLFAINRLGVGGAEILVLEQLAAMDRRRFAPELLTIYPNPAESFESKIPSGTPYHALRFRGFLDVAAWRALFALLRRGRYDAVITNLFDTNLIVRMAAIACGVPAIFSYEHNVYADKRRWQILADRVLARGTTKILCGSRQVRDFTARQERLPLEKLVINYNAAKLIYGDAHRRREDALRGFGLDPAQTYITTAGRLIEQKGHPYLIEAMRAVCDTHPHARALIFGEGHWREKLERQIEGTGLAERVRLMGVAPMPDIVAATDIFAFPSLWEGLSIALINMMDAGRPIVATLVAGTEEALADGESGIVVPIKDPRALADGINDLLDHQDKAARLGQGAKAASRRFSIEANVRVLEDLIETGRT